MALLNQEHKAWFYDMRPFIKFHVRARIKIDRNTLLNNQVSVLEKIYCMLSQIN